MFQQALYYIGIWSKNVLSQLCWVSSNQDGDQFAEVTAKHGIELFVLINLDKFEEPIKKCVLGLDGEGLILQVSAHDSVVLFLWGSNFLASSFLVCLILLFWGDLCFILLGIFLVKVFNINVVLLGFRLCWLNLGWRRFEEFCDDWFYFKSEYLISEERILPAPIGPLRFLSYDSDVVDEDFNLFVVEKFNEFPVSDLELVDAVRVAKKLLYTAVLALQ